MKSKIEQYDDDTFKELVASSASMRELSRKLGYTGGGYNGEAILKRCESLDITTEHFTGLAKGFVKRSTENVFIENSTASQTTLRRWYQKGEYSEYKCTICGMEPFWNGKELTLTLDHINGINGYVQIAIDNQKLFVLKTLKEKQIIMLILLIFVLIVEKKFLIARKDVKNVMPFRKGNVSAQVRKNCMKNY